MERNEVLKIVLLIYFSLVIVVPVYGVSVTDQQQLLTDDIYSVAIGGDYGQELAQVITAGMDGELIEFRLHIGESQFSTEPLHVEVQEVTDGIPNGVIITEEIVPSGVLPNILDDDSWDSITFSNPAYFNSGDQFAIVLWSEGTYSCLSSPIGDFYLGGDGYFICSPNPPDVWVCFFTKLDLAFQTVVELRASVSGYILYNDEPVTQYTDLMPSFLVRDEDTGMGVEPEALTYDTDDGYYEFFGLPPGRYGVGVFIDAAEPYNTEKGFPDDYEGWNPQIIIPEGDITVTHDLVVEKVIHLTSPVDNIEEKSHGDERDTYDGSPLFTWEPITEASQYSFQIEIYEEPLVYLGKAYSTMTSLTSLQPGLPLNGENEFYLCSIWAYNEAGTTVGNLMLHCECGGHGWDYRFKIGPSPEDQIDEVIDFFEDSVSTEDIVGDGPGKSAKGRLKALGNMLHEAEILIQEGFYDEAYIQLMDVYQRCDGDPRPPDFVVGDSADELAGMILALLECLE